MAPTFGKKAEQLSIDDGRRNINTLKLKDEQHKNQRQIITILG